MNISSKGTYYGEKNTEKSFNGLLLSQYDYHTERTPWHYHENPYFMYVLTGNMKDCNSRKETLCPAGSLMFNNWQEPHFGSKHSKEASGFHFELDRSWFETNNIDLNLFEGSQGITNPLLHILFFDLYREFCLSDTESQLSVEQLAFQVCDGLQNDRIINSSNIPEWVYGLKELLHYDTSDVSLTYLSKELGVHPVHISRTAQKYFSTTLGEYRRQLKLKKALPLIMNKELTLTQIAYKCGFSDQSHFIRVFKSYFNSNPNVYRKELSQE